MSVWFNQAGMQRIKLHLYPAGVECHVWKIEGETRDFALMLLLRAQCRVYFGTL